MKLTPALEVLWQAAGHQALASGYGVIEPEHLLLALTAFAVAPLQQWTAWLPGGPAALDALSAEVEDVGVAFRRRRLDPSEIGRRVTLPPRPAQSDPAAGAAPLAPSCQAALERAAESADAEGVDLSARHLLEALLRQPPPSLCDLLRAPAPPSQAADRPELSEHPPALAARAVVDLLRAPERWNVLLVGERVDAQAVLDAVDELLSAGGMNCRLHRPPNNLGGLGVAAASPSELGSPPADQETILCYEPVVDPSPVHRGEAAWAEFFPAADAAGHQWLACLTLAQYTWLERRPRRAPRHARVVWLHPALPGDVPWEL